MIRSMTEIKAKIASIDRELYRAKCRVKCLEAKLLRIEPEEFDALMAQLEAAKSEQQQIAAVRYNAQCDLWDAEADERRKKLHAAGSGSKEKS